MATAGSVDVGEEMKMVEISTYSDRRLHWQKRCINEPAPFTRAELPLKTTNTYTNRCHSTFSSAKRYQVQDRLRLLTAQTEHCLLALRLVQTECDAQEHLSVRRCVSALCKHANSALLRQELASKDWGPCPSHVERLRSSCRTHACSTVERSGAGEMSGFRPRACPIHRCA